MSFLTITLFVLLLVVIAALFIPLNSQMVKADARYKQESAEIAAKMKAIEIARAELKQRKLK